MYRGIDGWNPSAKPDGGSFFGVYRDESPIRFAVSCPVRKHGLRERLRDAWVGLLNGWSYGPEDR